MYKTASSLSGGFHLLGEIPLDKCSPGKGGVHPVRPGGSDRRAAGRAGLFRGARDPEKRGGDF